MKRLAISKFLTLFFSIQVISTPVLTEAAANPITVEVDDIPIAFDVEPMIEQGRTLVPFRAIAEALNVEVVWNPETKTIHAQDEEFKVGLQIGSHTADLNGKPTLLEAAPTIQNGRTLIPLRFFSEAFKAEVKWNGETRQVEIISPPKEMKVVGFYALGGKNEMGDTRSWPDLFGAEYPEMTVGNTDIIQEVSFGWYSLDEQGNLLTDSATGWQRPEGWEDVLDAAKGYKLESEMVIHLPDRDETMMKIISNDETRAQAIQSIVEEAQFFQGINLDIEGLGWKQSGDALEYTREQFNLFVRELSQLAKEKGISLTLTLHPPNSAYLGYDYQTLGQLADEIIIMAYDYLPTAGPEPLQRVMEAVEMAVAVVPAGKLLLGISAYHETPESIRGKIGVAKQYDLKGIAVWRLGLMTDALWDRLKSDVIKEG